MAWFTALPESRHQADDLQDLRRVTVATDLQVGAVGPNPVSPAKTLVRSGF